MYILGLDTTQAACSAAIFNLSSRRICARVWEKMPRGHAEALPAIIAKTLDQAGLSFADITSLATSVGPGTFTGVRVGLSAARGFALALDLPLVGITSLEAIAAGVENYRQKTILAAFDARRDEVYVQLFDKGEPSQPPQLLDVKSAANLTGGRSVEVVGTASILLVEQNSALVLSQASDLPDAAVVATLAARQESQDTVQPLYLRRADAKAQTPLLNIQSGQLELKQVNANHCEILADIHAQGFSNPWSVKNIATSLLSPGVKGLLASGNNDEPLGFILIRDAAGEREILTIAVRLDARRRSVASFLLKAISGEAGKEGIKKVFLEVSENNFAAQNLYKKFGFATCGRRKKYYTENDGQKYDAIVMEQTI
ncbi:tRNA threonylcarbamoyladenosine biosynthesis protein TsaB [hydrothermal vent metagenome]|uniref:tRNA threonylcarbamoyladenosine biosynthesis protein TsaB n=1 Tax=hydrothermal vent metagenome TaxID=652676 RepID=A0A3B0RBX9_9ZZZZ